MNWFLLALAAPLAWSVANYIDTYVLTREDGGGSGGLIILSSLLSVIFAVALFAHSGGAFLAIGQRKILTLVASGVFEGLYIYFYFMALERENPTTVVSLFQFAPIMGFMFGFLLLGEVPGPMQFVAAGLILIGTLLILAKKKAFSRVQLTVLCIMLLSTLFVGLYNVLFKIAGEGIPFWTGIFWQYIGIGILGAVLFACSRAYRGQFAAMCRTSKSNLVVLILVAELLNIAALLATNAAVLRVSVGLVLSVTSVQPLFVFLEGLVLAWVAPRVFDGSRNITFRMQYVIGIVLICAGGLLVY